ncbi:MAG TPA: hypothetical protein VFB42_11425 [Gaiellaceae bacterium]|nr:hypothetical protein [Gaiellaceae bacterium]
MSTTLQEPTLPDLVLCWRLERLIAAGYPRHSALALSEQKDVDLHLAVRLLETGCPVETALRILL